MKRKIYQRLLAWKDSKDSKDRKPLVLLGARQVFFTINKSDQDYKNILHLICHFG